MNKKQEIYNTRLSTRQGAKAAAYLNEKGTATIKTALCNHSTPMQIARYYLGNKSDSELEKLAVEIAEEVGIMRGKQ